MPLVVAEVNVDVIVARVLDVQPGDNRIERANLRLDQLPSGNFYFRLIVFGFVAH